MTKCTYFSGLIDLSDMSDIALIVGIGQKEFSKALIRDYDVEQLR